MAARGSLELLLLLILPSGEHRGGGTVAFGWPLRSWHRWPWGVAGMGLLVGDTPPQLGTPLTAGQQDRDRLFSPGSVEPVPAVGGHRGARGQTPLPALHGAPAAQRGPRLRGSAGAPALGADSRPLPPPGVSPAPLRPTRHRGLGGGCVAGAGGSVGAMWPGQGAQWGPYGQHRAPTNTGSRHGAGRSPRGRRCWGCTAGGSAGRPPRASPSGRPVPTPATTDRRWRTTCSCSRWGLCRLRGRVCRGWGAGAERVHTSPVQPGRGAG